MQFTPTRSIVGSAPQDDLAREVYCILGVPVDSVGMRDVIRRIHTAAASRVPLLISTPNLNFLIKSQSDPEFRETLLMSDLCTADGVPIVWIARFLGIPIKGRVAGSDIFEQLKVRNASKDPLRLFFFGGAPNIASSACQAINAEAVGLYCVGSLQPGFGSVDEMSSNEIIDCINSTNADFIIAALGAPKGQSWLHRNHHRLLVPVRAHLGATMNFQAGVIQRCPKFIQRLGFEWLWRIKEEPNLLTRYLKDGSLLIYLLLTRVLPLIVESRRLRRKYRNQQQHVSVEQLETDGSIKFTFFGFATAHNLDKIIPAFARAVDRKKKVFIDLCNVCCVDARFLGLLLMFRKALKYNGTSLTLLSLPKDLSRTIQLHGLRFLTSDGKIT
jgi:N-acetylglucosaminyldiphosphoundecaprenol N-acetyl-beta-D-mannosaminyltransferase